MKKRILHWGSIFLFLFGTFQESDSRTGLILPKPETADSTAKTGGFDLHLGAGWVSGLRLGIRKQFGGNYFGEISYGNSLNSYLGGATLRNIFGMGVGWLPQRAWHFTVNLLLSYVQLPKDSFVHSYIISPNVGFVSIRKSGIHPFIRTGIFAEFKQNGLGKSVNSGINLDVGLAWGFRIN